MPTSQIQPIPSQSSTMVRDDKAPTGGRPSAGELLDAIREHTRAGQIRTAQRLAREAAEKYPTDSEIQKARRTLTGGRSTPRPGTGRSLREEYEWLRNPPAEYRGRCVALVGGEVIAIADTLEELRESLPSHPGQTPLAVQVAS